MVSGGEGQILTDIFLGEGGGGEEGVQTTSLHLPVCRMTLVTL